MELNKLHTLIEQAYWQLERCPFCGCKPDIGFTVFWNADTSEYDMESVKIECGVCNCAFEEESCERTLFGEEVIERCVSSWNRRSDPPEPRQLAPDELPF